MEEKKLKREQQIHLPFELCVDTAIKHFVDPMLIFFSTTKYKLCSIYSPVHKSQHSNDYKSWGE